MLQRRPNAGKDDTSSTFRWYVALVCLALFCSLTRSAELSQHLPPLLPSAARAIDSHLYYSLNKINHKVCKAGHKTGVCMFVWECMKTRGHHSGMCMDGFMFGSCCTHEPEGAESSPSASVAFPQSVAADKPLDTAMALLNQIESQKTLISDLVTSKPHLSTRPSYSGLLRPVYSPLTTSYTTSTTASTSANTEKEPSTTSLATSENTTPAMETLNLSKTSPPVTIKPPKAPTRPTRPPKPPKPVRPTLKPWWIYSHKTKKPTINTRTTTKPTTTKTTTTSKTTATVPSTTKAITAAGSTLPPPHGPFTTNVHSKHVCGMQRMSPQPEGRIVNGTNSRYGEFPWQTSVRRTSFFGFSSTHRCGGALLNSKWVATAGHCVDDLLVSQIRLRVGEYDFSSVLEPHAYVERKAKKKVVHPNYNFFTYEYDLALVEMESPVEFQPHIQPICLPGNQDLLIGEMARVTGWGRLSEHGTLPSILQQASVPIMSNGKCQEMFLNGGRKEHIPDIFLCAGYENGGRDSCQGDSGGPLQVKGADGRWFLAGIISWGIGCAEPNLPGVCTRISKFVPFILEHVT